jgi:hypothetical protein
MSLETKTLFKLNLISVIAILNAVKLEEDKGVEITADLVSMNPTKKKLMKMLQLINKMILKTEVPAMHSLEESA